jgi:hypothetical protein
LNKKESNNIVEGINCQRHGRTNKDEHGWMDWKEMDEHGGNLYKKIGGRRKKELGPMVARRMSVHVCLANLRALGKLVERQ